MPINLHHVAAGSLVGNFSSDLQNCFIHFLAQNLNKNKLGKEAYERLYTLYNQLYFNNQNTDNRVRFDNEIQHLSKTNPKLLEQRLGQVVNILLEDHNSKTGGAPLQKIVNFFGSMGISCEAYLKPNLSNPLDIYSLFGLRSPNLNANAPKFKILASGSPFDPQLEGYEYIVDEKYKKEDVECLLQHRKFFEEPLNVNSPELSSAMPAPLNPGVETRTSERPSKKPRKNPKNAESSTGVKASHSPKEMLSSFVDGIGQIFNFGEGTKEKSKEIISGIITGIFGFLQKIASFFEPLIKMFSGFFGQKEEKENNVETPSMEVESNDFEDCSPENCSPLEEKVERENKLSDHTMVAPSSVSNDLTDRLRTLQERYRNGANLPVQVQMPEQNGMPLVVPAYRQQAHQPNRLATARNGNAPSNRVTVP